MTSATKVYSAPRLEALSLRSTRDINIDVHTGLVNVDIHIGGTLFS